MLSMRSDLLERDPEIRQTRKVLHPAYFELEVPASLGRQAISLAATRVFLLFVALNPVAIEQAAQRAIESAGAQHDASVAHLLDVLENGVAMPRLPRQAEQNEQDGFGKGQRLHYGLRRHVA